jgi:DNA repair photolyase
MTAKYVESSCRSAIGRTGVIQTRFWTNYCCDPYNNCEFNCVYCHVATHKYGNSPDFSTPVYIKTNIPQILAREIAALKRKGIVRLSEFTDPYQPAEKKYQVTKQILEVLNEHHWPFAIGTKSDLILRDLNLISQISEKSWCCVALSITTLDENLAKLIEPTAPSPQRRLEAVRRLSEAGIAVGVWLEPVIPYVTDSEDNIAGVVKAAVESGAMFVLSGMLDMRNSASFKRFLEEHFKLFAPRYAELYKGRSMNPSPGDMNEAFVYSVYRRFISLCQRYGVESYIPHFCSRKQAVLFYVRNFSRFRGTPAFELTQALNYMSPSREFLQTVRIRFGDSEFIRRFLRALGYFPN